MLLFCSGCAGKYLVKTYPSGAKVYTQDIKSADKKLVGLSPVQITEDSDLGDVFFLVVEKEKYKAKNVMVRVNPGESLTISTQLDPVNPDEQNKKMLAENENEKDKGEDPPPTPPKDDKKDDENEEELAKMKDEMIDLNLRISLLENTTDFYKDAMFSSRFSGNNLAKFDRDKNDTVVELMFQAQKAIGSNDLKKALQLIDEAIQKDAYVTNAWLLKGSVKYLQKDYIGAKTSWERSLKMDPYNKVALKYLNGVYKKLGQKQILKRPRNLRKPAALRDIDLRRRTQSR